jgi:hypothetical protein
LTAPGRGGSRRAGFRARALLFTLSATVVPVAPAHADWLVTPFIGTTFGISTSFQVFDLAASSTKHLMFGASATWLSEGILGFEGEYAHAPRFFQEDEGGLVLESQVSTLSGHFMLAAPLAVTGDSLRPFVLAGLGLVHSNIQHALNALDVNDNSLGLQLGGGAIGFISNRAALRFDLRHVRTLSRATTIVGERDAKLGFWRAAIGVAIRF